MDVFRNMLEIISCMICLIITDYEAACVLPQYIQSSDWIDQTSTQLSFGTSSMAGLNINARGSILNTYNCISNIGNVLVFKSDKSYTDRGRTRWIYLCMKMTKISNNLFYFYLLADMDTSVIPNYRVYNPKADVIPLDSQETCKFCEFTTAPSKNDFHLLRRMGTNESLGVSSPSLCLPCASSCVDNTTTGTTEKPTSITQTTLVTTERITTTTQKSTLPTEPISTPTEGTTTQTVTPPETTLATQTPIKCPTINILSRTVTLCHPAYTKKQKWRPCFGHRLEAVHIPNICVRYSVLHDQDGSCLGCPSYISSEYYCYLQCKQCNNWRRCKCPAHCKRHNGRHYHTGFNRDWFYVWISSILADWL